MADRGITFSGAMVRALLEGRKTQTRRLLPVETTETGWMHIKGNGGGMACDDDADMVRLGPDYVRHAPGDRLYVREHWKVDSYYDPFAPVKLAELPSFDGTICYLATAPQESLRDPIWGRHRQAMHMPRWASRLWLLVTDVRVQRLQDISEADALAEGIVEHEATMTDPAEYTIGMVSPLYFSAVEAYTALWNSLHTEPGTRWEDNPWIYAVTFEVNDGNIDHIANREGEG